MLVSKVPVSFAAEAFERSAYCVGGMAPAASPQLFSSIIELWESQKPSTLDDVVNFVHQMRSLKSSLNLAIVDTRPHNSAVFRIGILYEATGVRSPLGLAYPYCKTLGDHPDAEFSKKFLLPVFQRVKNDKKIHVDLVRTKVLGSLTAYDQLILPMQTSQGEVDFALEVVNMRYVTEPATTVGSDTFLSLSSSSKACVDLPALHREGVVLVDASARLLSMNAAAMDIMAGRGLRIDNDYVRTEVAAETKMLHDLIQACSRGQVDAKLNYAIASREGRSALSLLIKRLPNQYARAGADIEAVIGIFIADPESIPLPTPAQLQQQFGLTPSEALVALEILSTDGVPAAATRLGTTVGTVKTHLIRIFSKTGTRRQSELVRLLLSIGHKSNDHAE